MPEYLSVTEFSQKHQMDSGRVRRLIADGRIPAIKIGNQWAISIDAETPKDLRVKTGKYRDWRKSQVNKNK